MSPVEIVFVLLGIGILVASCFVGSKEEKTDTAMLLQDEALALQKEELKKYAEQLLEEKSEEAVIKADDYLSKISNEKIMSVNDFSAQIIEKIDANHKEVVFLYDMLNQKEDEIKQTVQQFDHEKQELQEVIEDVIKLTKQIKSTMKLDRAEKTGESTVVVKQKKTESKKTTAKPAANAPVRTSEPVKAVENQSDGQLEFAEMLQSDRQKEEVLKMHKQGKSVLEISKAMGMGQGEVKLIIGLYGA